MVQVLFSLSLPPAPSSTTPRRFKKVLLPFATIDAETSSFNVTKFKVDVVLIKKVKGISWPILERQEDGKKVGMGSTFGRE